MCLLLNWFGLWPHEEKGNDVKLLNFEEAAPARTVAPVVKAKATSLMSSLMISKSFKATKRVILMDVTECSSKLCSLCGLRANPREPTEV